MVKRTLACLLSLSALLLAGCSEPATAEVGLGKEVTLAVGQSAAITGEDLRIEFVEVVSDSRCPNGAKCIWAGEASCLVKIAQAGSTYEKVLTQPGLSEPTSDTFGGYEVTFDVLPYPEVGKEIKAKDYELKLTVSR